MQIRHLSVCFASYDPFSGVCEPRRIQSVLKHQSKQKRREKERENRWKYHFVAKIVVLLTFLLSFDERPIKLQPEL